MSEVDLLTMGYAMLGGAFLGTYPVFVKTPALLAANVHPFIFQAYKSVWVFLIGTMLVAWRAISDAAPVFAFSHWSLASACAWVPAGCFLIAAVPRIGVGTAVLIFDGATTLFSFLTFWLVFHEPIRSRTLPNGSTFYLAPVYIACATAGMAGLVILPRQFARHNDPKSEPLLAPQPVGSLDAARSQTVLGYCFAVLAGLLSATQYGLVTVGKKLAVGEGIAPEALNPLGSWTASFGLGAVAVNTILLGALRSSSKPLKLNSQVTLIPGSAAGILYCTSLLLTTLAVERGGNAIVMAQKNAISLVVSGGWGVLWYKEIRGRALLAWCMAAAVTVASVVALGFEKQAPSGH